MPPFSFDQITWAQKQEGGTPVLHVPPVALRES